MRRYVGLGICLLLSIVWFDPSVHAETLYVKDVKITMRMGPENKRKIIDMLGAGQQVETIQTDGAWTYVRLPNGTEGWVLGQYLVPDKPDTVEVETLRKENEYYRNRDNSLKERNEILTQENQELKAENEALQARVEEKDQLLLQTQSDLENLKKKSNVDEFLKLKANYEKTKKLLDEQTKKADGLDREMMNFEKNQAIWWFLSGAGVLFVGFLIGLSSRRQRKKSSLQF